VPLDDWQNLNLYPTTGAEIVTNIAVALLCGLLISWIYRRTYRGAGYSVSFVNSIVLLAMITSLVIMVIGNNLARAFGLVGAMSIIRFRTPIKDTRDIVYIFFGLAAGMAAGVGYHKIAVIGTVFVGLVFYLLSRTNLTAPGGGSDEYLLEFSFSANGSHGPTYQPVLQRFCRRHRLINVRSHADGHDSLELSYYVRFRDSEKNDEFVRDLGAVPGVNRINLFFDEEQV
jgi:uncharacterized membrane protein YhiD involved in acid resistance